MLKLLNTQINTQGNVLLSIIYGLGITLVVGFFVFLLIYLSEEFKK